ncbi:glycoside hydrolase family 3 N-terminal domain-containing protein [Streptomyces sp. AN091965]|uniref:glycoside hydrolase family 3 N-terminal domain-containing protein n=1 Tax=Streptomyces sp. AN091965 TaxID=2927803 RepID=UPI001F60A2EA|nr:glycoside hydrolase family 3 N-terminal domain-containing protein [Streptomyces sp. AN091965]MCI3934061.1 glycoside hydrolase family 3 protein [Streptomyces sp. AN091965]
MVSSSPPRLEQLANSVLQPGFVGTTEVPDWLRRRIAAGLGGVVLFGRNIVDRDQVAGLTAALRAENPDLIVAIDEEAGDVTRMEAWTGASRPGNLALGAVDDIDLTERVARDIGRELHAAGVSLNYAPSADVNSNPLNPVIGVRSFGARTDIVSRHTAAWIRGLQSAGVAACAKHFPGHGDTSVDPHFGLPRVTGGAEEIARTALPPFIAAMESGVRAVMTAHLLVPAYDPALPATLSPRILNDLLRGELGFDGMVVTDGIEMGAVTDRYGIDGATVRAVAGGVDAVCVGGEHAEESTVDLLTSALVRAVHDGTLPEDRLTEAGTRVRSFATWSGARSRTATATGLRSDIGLIAARRAVRVRPRREEEALTGADAEIAGAPGSREAMGTPGTPGPGAGSTAGNRVAAVVAGSADATGTAGSTGAAGSTDTADTAGNTGTAGTAGSTGTAGTARSTGGGSTDAAGTVTSAGTAGAGGARGTAGAPGTPVDPLLPLTIAPHVVELSPVMNPAVDGGTPWGVADPLRALRPDTTSVRLTELELDGFDDVLDRAALTPADGRALVVVVRDAARHRWMTEALARLLRTRPDALVVEMGVPTGVPLGAVHLITHGATRVSGIAVAELLTGRSHAPDPTESPTSTEPFTGIRAGT